MENSCNIEIGTIFFNSWGYEQTNIDWYQVVGLTKTKKSLRFRKIEGCKTMNKPQDMQGTTTPLKDSFLSHQKPFLKRIQHYQGEIYIQMESGSLALWDGQPKRFSTYA